jgi:hypothetical protein
MHIVRTKTFLFGPILQETGDVLTRLAPLENADRGSKHTARGLAVKLSVLGEGAHTEMKQYDAPFFTILLNCSSNAQNETKCHGRMGLGALVAFSYVTL